MRLSDAVVSLLSSYAARPMARTIAIAPEDGWIYAKGVEDGATILAKEILAQLKPDVVVPEEIKESE